MRTSQLRSPISKRARLAPCSCLLKSPHGPLSPDFISLCNFTDMSGSRPGEENNGNASNRGPTTTAGLSIASKCQSTIPFKSGNSNLVASDTRDIDGREDFQCQPTKIDPIEPTPERPTGVRVGSQSFTSVYSSIVATSSLDIASGKSVLGPE